MCANDLDTPGTFVTNEGYYCDEEVKRNLLGLRITIQLAGEWRSVVVNSRLRHAQVTRHHCRVWAAIELGSTVSAPSELIEAACATVGWPGTGDHMMVIP